MDLQISVFLLFVLFTTGFSINCYECYSTTGSCADQRETACPEYSSCYSSTLITAFDTTSIKLKVKSCAPLGFLMEDYNSPDTSFFFCKTDLCNVKDAPEPFGGSSSDIDSSANGNKCYYCDGKNCSNIMNCSGNENRCITGTGGNFEGLSFAPKGCVSKSVCDYLSLYTNDRGVSCCSGNLCNSAKSVSQSFLFLCASLLSFIILH